MGLEKGAKTGQDRPRQAKTGQDKTKTRHDKDKTKTRQDKDKTRQDFGRQRERKDLFAGRGGGFHPAFRGRLHWLLPL